LPSPMSRGLSPAADHERGWAYFLGVLAQALAQPPKP
jgi:hypothetical protein